GHDVGVMEAGGGLRLELEALQLPGVECGTKRQDLQRHAAAKGNLLGLIHDAHAAPADLAKDAEIAEATRRWAEILRLIRGDRVGLFLAHEFERGECLPDHCCELREAADVVINLGLLAPAEPLEELVCDAPDQLSRRADWHRRATVHSCDSVSP